MKRKDILKKLKEAGFSFREGGNHTIVYDQSGRKVSVVGRHTEINEDVARKIERRTGIKLIQGSV